MSVDGAEEGRGTLGRAHGAQPMAARSGPITNVKIAGSVQQCTVYLHQQYYMYLQLMTTAARARGRFYYMIHRGRST